ncbi:MAG: hypothetical protein QOG79_4567, partial [Mycobacterium sp.]|nr:hypothetical protein [Mycobacterium sp.]
RRADVDEHLTRPGIGQLDVLQRKDFRSSVAFRENSSRHASKSSHYLPTKASSAFTNCEDNGSLLA